MKYTVDYFIERITKIDECSIGRGSLIDNCIAQQFGYKEGGRGKVEYNAFVKLLRLLPMKFECQKKITDYELVYNINDGCISMGYPQFVTDTHQWLHMSPKQRILLSLQYIKRNQYPELSTTTVEDIINEKVI